jgi:hypothetical protein
VKPRIALLVIGDGREDLRAETLRSFARATPEWEGGPIVSILDAEHKLGFAGAIREGWRQLRELKGLGFDYVFHLEEDWRFDRALDLTAMAHLLEAQPGLAQVALRRGPVNIAERKAGGVVEMWPQEYQQRSLVIRPYANRRAGPLLASGDQHIYWLQHELYFTTNPSLYTRELVEQMDWPARAGSEAEFTKDCLRAGYRFALWGARDTGAWITHTGTDRRTGTGY